MKKTILAAAVLSALGAASNVMAQAAAPAAPASPHTISYNVGLASEYSYRGISQSDNKPALSAGADYSHASGLYLGTWASTITWLEDTGVYDKSKLELDLYGGYKLEVAKDTTVDVGVLKYVYPGDKVAGAVHPNTTELYAALNYKTYGVKYSHSVTNLFGFADSKNSQYLDLYANIDIAEGTQLNLHYGKTNVRNSSVADYADYKIGVTKDFGFASGSLAYVKTTGDATDAADGTPFEDWYKGRVIASITKTF
jgi:uncharacterized protein (TIGR02001 family)